MAVAALSIKLRCASWQQLATIYRRDLSKGTMFLKASSQPPLGTLVRIDLTLPSSTVIELAGVIVKHVVDPARGAGVELQLEPLPTNSVWLIESALAAEKKVRAATAQPTASATEDSVVSGSTRALSEGQDIAEAETELVKALEAECESLRKLNPFLVLSVPYDSTDEAVRAAFGELTKRYHPDRFARYQSVKLRQVAAEIFIIIRDAYRKLADASGRQQVVAQLGARPVARLPPRSPAMPSSPPPPPPSRPGAIQRAPTPPPIPPPLSRSSRDVHEAPTKPPPIPGVSGAASLEPPTKPGPYDAPTNPSLKPAELATTELAKGDELAVPLAQRDVKSGPVRAFVVPASEGPKPIEDAKSGPVRAVVADLKSGPVRMPAMPPRAPTPVAGIPIVQTAAVPVIANPATSTASSSVGTPVNHDEADAAVIESLIEAGKLDDALAGYRALAKKHPNDRTCRAGIELCEGLLALIQRDRLEAAQRFEAALELDPSNERAARELAEMRRQATNERKGLLSRLMGKKEPPP
jgi:hypothetical protein